MKVATEPLPFYDVCIIGAGPAGLACLSAIREPYSIDFLSEVQVNRAVHSIRLHQCLRVCVIDPQRMWMDTWRHNFKTLDIRYLRSSALAHPNLFDRHALFAYAMEHGRENELKESGCLGIRQLLPLGQSQIGLWKLPSTQLFLDFCHHTAMSLDHDYIVGKVVDIYQEDDFAPFELTLSNNTTINATSVICAMGAAGRAIVPRGIDHCPRLSSWTDLHNLTSNTQAQHILVIGGGLTAVQVAQKVVRQGHTAVLCSRSSLIEKHFDIGTEWFDHRTSTKCIGDFYHIPLNERLQVLKEARGGGSVPPIYMKELLEMEKSGKLKCLVGEALYLGETEKGQLAILINHGETHKVDSVIVACGLEPDCGHSPLLQAMLSKWPLDVVGGFPGVSEDLAWTKNLFVVGSLGSLNIGPDAGNLMGIRRAAQIVANAMECRCWLREKVLTNPFDVFADDSDSDTEAETSSDEK